MPATPESRTETAQEPLEAGQRDGRHDRTSRLNQVLVWVGIVAGVAFVIALIFFSGFFLGAYSNGGHGGAGNYPQRGPGGSMGHGCQMGGMGSGGVDPGQQSPRPSR